MGQCAARKRLLGLGTQELSNEVVFSLFIKRGMPSTEFWRPAGDLPVNGSGAIGTMDALWLSQHFSNHAAMDVGEAEVATSPAVGEFLVVKS